MSADSQPSMIYHAVDVLAVMARQSMHASSKNCVVAQYSRRMGPPNASILTLRCALREAPDGLPKVSTFTILSTLHETGYTWQKNRTWCKTGVTLHKGENGVEEHFDPLTQEKKAVIERAYVTAERLSLQLWCEDEGGQDLAIPQPGSSWQLEGHPARRPHEYRRGGTAKLLTDVGVRQPERSVLRPWSRPPTPCCTPGSNKEFEAILKQCPPAPEAVPEGRRWQDWDIYPAADQFDRFFPHERRARNLG